VVAFKEIRNKIEVVCS
jgi:hypothetical protein